jgi:hypothetical protein
MMLVKELGNIHRRTSLPMARPGAGKTQAGQLADQTEPQFYRIPT